MSLLLLVGENRMKKTLLKYDGEENWAIVDGNGKIIKRFRNKATAQYYIQNIRLNKYDKYTVVFVTPNS